MQKDSYHHGDLRRSLIKAAVDLIGEKGPQGLSLREVAKRAGVSHAAPYRHFSDKEELLQAIAAQGFSRLEQAMIEVQQAWPDDPRRQLVESGVAYVELAVDHPEITLLMFGGHIDPRQCEGELKTVSENAFMQLAQVVENGVKAGVLRNEETRTLALIAWSGAHGLAMLYTGGSLRNAFPDKTAILQMARIQGEALLTGIEAKN